MTDIQKGLSQSVADEKIRRGECNGSFSVKSKSVGRIFADNIFTLFNLINVIIAVLVALVGAYRNMLFMGVILCNIAIGIFQEIRSKRIIDRLSVISAPKAHLLRDGEETILPVSDIVPGDIMLLSAGRQICADGTLVQGALDVDESLLTGESETVTKRPGDVLYSGSFVVSGSARAEVTKVGAEAYANSISASAKKPKKRHSEMMSAINSIISVISVCILPFALILFTKALFVAREELQYCVTSTAAAVIGMIPEGLVLLTSIALAVSSIRLAKRQTLCQDLYCVESLARVDVLCLDKTGTITTGKMQVSGVKLLDEAYPAESALAAAKGGASRLELCQNLVIGGTTPGSKLFEVIRRQTTIPIHALIRPRFGDFCYTPYELEEICEEVAMYRELGAEGVVIGVLKEDGTMNMTAMEQLMEAANGMSVTLHRAFDVCRDPKEALEQAVSLGMNTILTSGQQNSAVKGAELLAELQRQAAGRIRIQAGGGICADAIRELYPKTGVTAYHMSGKIELASPMQYRKENVNMGLPSLSEYTLYRTDVKAVRSARAVLEEL